MNGALFITGTDTGVGKTLLTAALVFYLRDQNRSVLAMKPFASGSRGDTEILFQIQNGDLPASEITPFFFRKPVAPYASTRSRKRALSREDVLGRISAVKSRCECLIIEGIGGVMVPLTRDFAVLDLIAELNCPVVIVCPNKLGAINQVRLTLAALQGAGLKAIKVMLMGVRQPGDSATSNAGIIAEIIDPVPVIKFPFLGDTRDVERAIKDNFKKIKKSLAQVLSDD